MIKKLIVSVSAETEEDTGKTYPVDEDEKVLTVQGEFTLRELYQTASEILPGLECSLETGRPDCYI